jgi:hypothetical protein
MSTDGPLPSPDPNFREPYFPLAKVHVKVPFAQHDKDGIIHPSVRAGIITTNGQLWLITLSAFQACEELVCKLWNTQPSLFYPPEAT